MTATPLTAMQDADLQQDPDALDAELGIEKPDDMVDLRQPGQCRGRRRHRHRDLKGDA